MIEQYELKGIDALDIWAQMIKEHMAAAYQRSNFYDVQPQFTHDGLTTGSPLMFCDEQIVKERGMWIPQHYTKARIYYDIFNEVEGCIIRDDTWTAKQIVDTFAKNDPDGTKRKAKFPVSVNNAYDMGNLEEAFVMYRATFKVTDTIWESKGEDKFKRPQNQNYEWFSVYFLELADAESKEKKNTPLNDNIGYFSQPFAQWDFDKKKWESASRTPAWYSIWDCMGLQQIDKNLIENMQLKNRPPTISPNSMKNRLKLSSEGQMFVSDDEYERPPKPVDVIGDITLNAEMVEIKIEALKRWFYIDQFQMFSDLTKANKAPVATIQIWQMAGEKATLLSPAIETHSKYLEAIDDRMMDIEMQAGRGPFARDIMENITDIVQSALGRVSTVSVRPVFVGALAQAQKAGQILQPIESTMTAVRRNLLEIYPELRHKYRAYEIAGDIEEALDFPQDKVVPKDEYDERVAAEAEAKAKQQQFENQVDMAKAAKSVSGPVDETSVIEQVKAGAAG